MTSLPPKPRTPALRPLTPLQAYLVSPLSIRVEGDTFRLCEDGDGPVATFAPAVTPAGELFDIIAWLYGFPEQWWSLRGLAQILGEPEVALAELHCEPLVIYETPAAWRRSRGTYATCIVDWDCDPRFAFPGVTEIVCETDRLRERLLQRARVVAAPSFNIPSTRGR